MARAVRALGEQLQAEATCPLCLELFSEPLITECGHSFCRRCLQSLLGVPPRPAACPQCRGTIAPGSLRPNHSLGAVAELAGALEKEAARPRCPTHGEDLWVFCESCRVPLCPLCREGPQHRDHRILLAREAARELRKTLQSNLVFLQKEKEGFKPKGAEEINALQEKVSLERQQLQDTFKELQQFLQEQEGLLLSQLDRARGDLTKEHQEYESRVSERRSLLDTLVVEIEKKCEQPVVEFLMDVGKTLSRCEEAKAPVPEPISPELQRRLQSLSATKKLVVGVVAKFKASLLSSTDAERVKVTLDPGTANQMLMLSKDLKTVTLGRQHLLNNARRFMKTKVLGSQGFSSGRHYWELEVGTGSCCAVGVALESLLREEAHWMLREKVWALELDLNGQYRALHSFYAPLELQEKLRKIRVHLDYEAGQVTFYNAETMGKILHLQASFTEKVFPFFWLQSPGSSITLCD